MRFVIWGDSKGKENGINKKVLNTIMFKISTLNPKPEYMVMLGDTVAVNCTVSPTLSKVTLVLFKLTPVVAMLTVTVQVALLLPEAVVTVIVAVPFPTAVTTPVLLTVATAALEDTQYTFLPAAFAGATVAANVSLAPGTISSAVLFKVTLVAAVIFFLTFTFTVAFAQPSADLTVIFALPGFLAQLPLQQ